MEVMEGVEVGEEVTHPQARAMTPSTCPQHMALLADMDRSLVRQPFVMIIENVT